MKFGSRDVANVVLKNIATGRPVLYLDSLTVSTMDVTGSTEYARGGDGNPKRIAWDGDKEVNYSMTDALISSKALSLLAGSDLGTGIALAVHKKEGLAVTGVAGSKTVPVLVETPKLGENLFIFISDDGKTIGTEAVVATDYTITDGQISIVIGGAIDLATDKFIIVDYYWASETTAQSILITADKFPGYFKLEADTLWRSETDGVDYPAQYTMPKIKIMPNFTIKGTPDGTPATFDFNVEAFPSGTNSLMAQLDIII